MKIFITIFITSLAIALNGQNCDTINFYEKHHYVDFDYFNINPTRYKKFADQGTLMCFPREAQARRQKQRLNIFEYRAVLNEKGDGLDLIQKRYVKCDSGYCITVSCEDAYRTYGDIFNRRVIKKRHYKYLKKQRHTKGFKQAQCWLEYRPSKFQLFINKIKKRILQDIKPK